MITEFPAMDRALELAQKAASLGEVPVGAVITQAGKIIAEAHNETRLRPDPTAHAEILSLQRASIALNSERLLDCDLYVTLEPCPMCAGAISHARIRRLYFAASDPKSGGVLHGPRVFQQSSCHHTPDIYHGMQEQEAASLLRDFFSDKR